MKYGNMVSKGWLPFTEQEINELAQHFSQIVGNVLGFDRIKENAEIEYEALNKMHSLFIRVYLKEPFTGRNVYKDRIFNATMVDFMCHKNGKGWLEIKDDHGNIIGKDEENCPDFQYSCSMYVSGKEIPYRCKTRQSIQNWSPYVYGTEISDLDWTQKDKIGLRNTFTPIDK